MKYLPDAGEVNDLVNVPSTLVMVVTDIGAPTLAFELVGSTF